ncbi:MAG: NgoFVII family restriction endonuclease [Spirochaetes bacterium]|nr:NgoFVII family restriction endonuclease [Spirochaetota bacterium]
MIYDNLYEKVLIQPYKEGADKLQIISGYATSAMAFHHLEELKTLGTNFNISLLIGMCPSDGISLSNHRGFQSIMKSEYSKNFSCSYIFELPSVHSKIYTWFKKNILFKSFIGSANYTQNAFYQKQREILAEINDNNVIDYFNILEKDSIYCQNLETEQLIKIYNDKYYYPRHKHEEEIKDNKILNIPNTDNLENVTISLLSRNGEVQNKGGLNWGQREGRNPNQAYIQLPPEVYRSDFFPLRTQHFTVVTDDSKTFICTRAQKSEEGQAIETPHNNSLLGEYFRNRLGLKYGEFITREHLVNYGRTDVTFYKFDDENYLMDFSVNN